MAFRDSSDTLVGSLGVRMNTSTPLHEEDETNYVIRHCMPTSNRFSRFGIDVPRGDEKVWRVEFGRFPENRLSLYCNDLKLVEFLMSDSNCRSDKWKVKWGALEVKRVRFDEKLDTASKYFRLKMQPQPGN